MTRSKTEPTPSIVNDWPMLPSDSLVDAPPLANTKTTEMTSAVTEPRSDAHAKPETAPLSLFDRLKAEAEAEKLAAETEWESVVKKVATDSASDMEVSDVLFASGKSISDLEAAVTRQKKVTRLQSLIDDIEPALAAEAEARRAFKELQREQDLAIKAMKAEHKRVSGLLHTATWRRTRAQNARFDLDAMSREWGAFIPPPPQWTDQYNPEPCIAEQLKVEERVNEEIRQRIKAETGQEPTVGPYCAGGTAPGKNFRVFANQ